MKNIHESITKLLNDKLKKYVDEKVNKAISLEIYQDIFYSLTEIFRETQAPLSNESANLLSQMYYDCVSIKTGSGLMELDPNIFDKRASFDNIPTKEIALLATLMRDSPFAPVFISHLKKR